MKTLKIGLVVADEHEFIPFEEYSKSFPYKSYFYMKNKYIEFSIVRGDKKIEVTSVLCGIGKVNAASAAATLFNKGKADIMINFGLSGIIEGLHRGDILISTTCVEHDFDITPFGYKIGEKPQETSIYKADESLVSHFTGLFPHLQQGATVCGDQFISENNKKEFLRETFGAMSCDMESAAIASVCYQADIPFISIRKMSDLADESATDEYSDMNNSDDDALVDIVMNGILKLFDTYEFFL